jgi:anti-sigma factor RsiW
MKHEEIEVYLSGYIDGELTEREERHLDSHIETCAACNALVKDLKQVIVRVSHLRIRLSKEEWERMGRHIRDAIMC